MNDIRLFEELYNYMNPFWINLDSITKNNKSPHGNLHVMCDMLNNVEKLEKILRILNKLIARILPKLENTFDISSKERLDMRMKLLYIEDTNKKHSIELESIKKALRNGGKI